MQKWIFIFIEFDEGVHTQVGERDSIRLQFPARLAQRWTNRFPFCLQPGRRIF